MKIKTSILAFLTIFTFLFSSCDFLLGNGDEKQNGNGDNGNKTLKNPYTFTAKNSSQTKHNRWSVAYRYIS